MEGVGYQAGSDGSLSLRREESYLGARAAPGFVGA